MAFDLAQFFTPPKSKTPWTAMTEGSTGEWAEGVEQWGPLINSLMKYIPYVGPALSVGGGLAGMEGRGTGFQGTDYGWGNVMPSLTGMMSGLYSNPMSGIYKGALGYWNQGNNPLGGYNTTYDRRLDPTGSEFNIGQLGSMIGNVAGNYFGNNMMGQLGSRMGGQIGTQVQNTAYGRGAQTTPWR